MKFRQTIVMITHNEEIAQMQNMKGTPYERLVKLYETHPEWFTHGTSEKKYFDPIVYGEKSINSHISVSYTHLTLPTIA